MKLLRHILSHSILIGFVALVVLGFYYRAALFPAGWNEQISQQVDRVAGPYAVQLHAFAAPETSRPAMQMAEAPPVESLEPVPVAVTPTELVQTEAPSPAEAEVGATAEAKSMADKSAETATMVEPVIEQQPTTASAPAAVVEQQPAAASAPEAVVEQQQPAVVSAPEAVVEQQPAVASAPEAVVEQQPAVASAPAAVVKQQPVVASAPEPVQSKPAVSDVALAATQPAAQAPAAGTPVDPDEVMTGDSSDQALAGVNDLWVQARAAYGRGDMAGALKHYLALSEQEADNPDVFGELGNVYYARGNFPEAGQAYYEAAIRLLELGQMGQVDYLVRVIEGLSPDNAAKLKQRLIR